MLKIFFEIFKHPILLKNETIKFQEKFITRKEGDHYLPRT